MLFYGLFLGELHKSVKAVVLAPIIWFCLHAAPMQLHAQSPSMTIRATAEVVSRSEIEIITINNLEIDIDYAVGGIIYISPFNNEHSGAMRIIGRPLAMASIYFDREVILTNSSETGTLLFTFDVLGFSFNNQFAGVSLNTSNRTIRFNQFGEFFIWVGGRIDISDAKPGNYAGDFTVEFEYL